MMFTREILEEFRKAYEQARERKDESFMFQDHEILVDYAKHLIEYLDPIVVPKK